MRREIWPDNVIENEYGLIGNLLPRECEAQPNNLNFGGRANCGCLPFHADTRICVLGLPSIGAVETPGRWCGMRFQLRNEPQQFLCFQSTVHDNGLPENMKDAEGAQDR